MKKRILSLTTVLALCLTLLPAPALGAESETPNAETGGFTVEGGTSGTDYSYADGVLTILSGEALTISGTTTADKVVIGENVAANLTFSDLSIELSEGCAFTIPGISSATITLVGNNTLRSGTDCAGLAVVTGGAVTIKGDGALSSTGGSYAAGIGGTRTFNAGTINIEDGSITATGGTDAAGIGGGHSNDDQDNQYGLFDAINITGGVVNATAPGNAAAIGTGCWAKTCPGSIKIENAQVTAATTGNHKRCAAIGRGISTDDNNYDCAVTIRNSFVSAQNVAEKGNTISGASGTPDIQDSIVKVTAGSTHNGVYNVYGSYALTESWTIPADTPLFLDSDSALTVAEGVTLTNQSTIINHGTITIEGTVQNNGDMINAGTLTVNGTIQNGSFMANNGTLTNNGTVQNSGRFQTCEGSVINGSISGTASEALPAIPYLACDENGQNWNTQKCTFYTEIADNTTTTWGVKGVESWYVVKGEVIFPGGITVRGDVHLILADGCQLTVQKGIIVNSGNSLTIYGQRTDSGKGQLTAIGNGNGVAIGSGMYQDSGEITIHGGHVIAQGTGAGSGIGGGYGGKVGTIRITGGYVEALGVNGAAIGSGYVATGGSIIITGGTVVARSIGEGDGIGGGGGGRAENVTIRGQNTVVITSSIDASTPSCVGGLVVNGKTGTLYSDPLTLRESVTIPEGVTVNLKDGQALIIPEGVTLTMKGKFEGAGVVDVKGTVAILVSFDYGGAPDEDLLKSKDGAYKAAYGELPTAPAWTGHTFLGWFTQETGGVEVTAEDTVETPGSHTLYAHWRDNLSQTMVTLSSTEIAYGESLTITATAAAKAANSLPAGRSAAQDKVQIFVNNQLLTELTPTVENGAATVTLTIANEAAWDGYKDKFRVGENTVKVEFGALTGLDLLGSTATATLTVTARPRTIPTPTAEKVTASSVTLAAVTAEPSASDDWISYGCSTTEGTIPVDWKWQSSAVFTDLFPDTTYYFYAKVNANNDAFYSEAVSGPLTVTTGKAQEGLPEGGLCLNDGSITVKAKEDVLLVTQGETTYAVSKGTPVRVTGRENEMTPNTVTVRGADVNLVLDNVNQGSEEGLRYSVGIEPAYDENYNVTAVSNVTLTLEGNNTLAAAGWCDQGIAIGENCTLTIEGPGALKIGNERTYVGIGIGKGEDFGDVVINGGTVDITARMVAIGAEMVYSKESLPSITINGGVVKTNVQDGYGVGIGTRRAYEGGVDITITGGSLELSGGGNSIKASEEMHYPPEEPAPGSVTITGGSISTAGTISPAPTDENGVPLVSVTIHTDKPAAAVEDLAIIGTAYGAPAQTDVDGNLILYLPAGEHTGLAVIDGKLIKITVKAAQDEPSTGASEDTGIQIEIPVGTKPDVRPDGSLIVPPGSTVTKPGTEPVTVTDPEGASVTPDGEVKKVFIITFEAGNGTATVSQTVAEGSKAIKPADPTRSGYTFSGWYTGADGATPWSFDDPVTASMTLRAAWREQFGQTGDAKTIAATYGTAVTQDLSVWMDYAGGTGAVGKFVYTITEGNINGISIEGDILTIGDTTAAGTYALTVTAMEKEPQVSLLAIDYGTEPVILKVQVTVDKATPIVNVTAAQNLSYTGSAQNLVTGTASGGELQYSADGTNYSATVPTGTDAGSYTVYYKVVGDSNHNSTEPETLTVSIAKATLTPTATVNGKTYDGNTSATGSITLAGAVNSEQPTATANFTFADANAGADKTVNVTAITLSDTWGDNYALSTDSLTTTAAITAKDIAGATVTLGDSLTYTGAEQTQSVQSVTIDGLEATYAVSNNTGTGANTYTLTVTGTGNFTGAQTQSFTIAQAGNSISNLTCADIVHGETPSPSATAAFGTPTYTYSNDQSTYGPWSADNHKGTWYVKASVGETDNYKGAEQIISFAVIAQREQTPTAAISYTEEALTGLVANAAYSVTPGEGAAENVTADGSGNIAIQENWMGKTLSIVRKAESDDFSDSLPQALPIPSRPAAPDGKLTLTKSKDSITITNPDPTCEYSIDGTAWNDAGAFTGLTAGQAYTVQVRVKATTTDFHSAAMTQTVTTVAADGSTTLKPGEKVEKEDGTVIENKGETVTIEKGGETITITPPSGGGDTPVGGDGSVTAPGGSSVTVPDGNGGNTTVTVPEGGGAITPGENGGATVPGGSTVDPEDGPQMTVPEGSTVNPDGTITAPGGEQVIVKTEDGETITVTIPEGGGTVKPGEDGKIEVPGGSTVTPPGGTLITIPETGGVVTPDGKVGYTVTFDTQNGKPTTSQFVPVGSKAAKPSAPTRSGYIFGGWYTEAACATAWDFDTAVTASMTLYAKWTAQPSGGGSSGGGGSSSRKPTVSVGGDGEGGKVTAGRDGTVTITPDEGYEIVKITVNGKEVDIPEDGKLKGLKRTDKVVVTFGEIPKPVPVSQRFTDIKPGAWYEDAVQFAVDNGLFNGTSETAFAPESTMTRGMLATVLYRLAQEPEITAEKLFSDVASDQYYAQSVAWAVEKGVVSGYGNGSFGPNDPITREQLATMLWRYAGSPASAGSLSNFTDGTKTSGYAVLALQWAVEQGIVTGKGGGILDPRGQATRAEVAAMLMRYCTKAQI